MRDWQDTEWRSRQRVEKALAEEAIEKGQDPAVDVRLAWYSTDSSHKNYHTCLNCPRYILIREDHLRFANDRDLPPDLSPCQTCSNRQQYDLCTAIIFRVSE